MVMELVLELSMNVYVDSNNNYWIGTTGGTGFYNGASFQNYGNFDGLGGHLV